MHADPCAHPKVSCLNPYELVRKYLCADCGAIMMCGCDEAIGLEFLPHQIGFARPHGGVRLPVTHGFHAGVCNSCRGLPEVPFPRSGKHRHRSKIERFYWREIAFEVLQREKAAPSVDSAQIRREIVDEIRDTHATHPKHPLEEESEAVFLKRMGIDPVARRAVYVQTDSPRAVVLSADGRHVGVEELVSEDLGKEGYDVVPLESRPIHVLFGTYMWLLIQDHSDGMVRMVGRAHPRPNLSEGPVMWFPMPEDFGTAQYAARRSAEIERHFELLRDRTELLWHFEYWLEPSTTLREYLGATNEHDVARARHLLQVLEPDQVLRILRYLVGSYWQRYCGWPDLLAWKQERILLVEVKSTHDKLSEDQRNWIDGNRQHLQLPFKFVKVHRASRKLER